MKNLIKFSSQIDETVLIPIKEITEQQGRKLQDVFDEALKDYIEKTRRGKARSHVTKAFGSSLLTYDSLYKKIAK